MIKYLNSEDEFKKLMETGTFLIDFYAEWCGPCKMQNLVLEEIDKCDIIKVDVDKFGDISNKFAILSIPTLVYIKGGIEQNRLIGYHEKDDIEKLFLFTEK